MLTIELFGFKATSHSAIAEIAQFFRELDTKIDPQFMDYTNIVPENSKGEETKVVRLIVSDNKIRKRITRAGFFKLSHLAGANVGLFKYIDVKRANIS